MPPLPILQYQSLFDPGPPLPNAVPSLDGWVQPTSQPRFDRARQQYLYPSVFFDSFPIPNVSITLDWLSPIDQPTYRRKQAQTPIDFLPPIPPSDPLAFVSQPTYRLRGIHQAPSYSDVLPSIPSFPSLLVSTPDRIDRRKAYQFLYPSFFFDPNPASNPVPSLAGWMQPTGEPPDDRVRAQYLYPSFFMDAKWDPPIPPVSRDEAKVYVGVVRSGSTGSAHVSVGGSGF